MNKDVLKDMVKGVETLAKEHMVITAVTCSVVVGGAGIGGVVAYNHAHADNNKVVESGTETSARDSSYKKLKERYQAVKSVIGELILDEEMSAKLTSDAEEIRAYIENSNSKSVEDDMLEKMEELEENVNKETNNSMTKLEEKETEVANLVATTNAPKFVETEEETSEETQVEGESTEETEAVILDDATLGTLDDMKKEYFSLKKANKYKSAYNKCGEIIDLIQNSTAGAANTESSDTETNENGDAGTTNSDGGNNGSGADTNTGTTASANSGSGSSGTTNSGSSNSSSSSSGNTGSSDGNSGSNNNSDSGSSNSGSQEQAPAEQPSDNKAGVAETFYDGSVGRGISAEEKAYIDGLVNSWLNGGYTNEGLQNAIGNYLMERGYTVSYTGAVKNTMIIIPNGKTYTLDSVMTGSELYYYGKLYTDGEVSGDGRIGYETSVYIS